MFCPAVWLLAMGLTLLSAQEECQVLTDSVNGCELPEIFLTSSPSGIEVSSSNCGEEFDKAEWQEQPSIIFPDAVAESFYTILYIDPDVTDHAPGEYFLHWIHSNVRGEDLQNGDLSLGTPIVEYFGPAPPEDTGIHRYMFLIFEESEENQEINGVDDRFNFNAREWQENQPKPLCGPIAGIEFTSQF